MTIPDAAIEAAAKAWHENGPAPASWDAASDSWKHGGLLRMEKSLEAAMPAIREHIAQEIRDDDAEWRKKMPYREETDHHRGFWDGINYAALVVEGGGDA